MPKALNPDNPKQAKRSSGNIEGVAILYYPELRFACKGLSKFNAFGVPALTYSCIFKKIVPQTFS